MGHRALLESAIAADPNLSVTTITDAQPVASLPNTAGELPLPVLMGRLVPALVVVRARRRRRQKLPGTVV